MSIATILPPLTVKATTENGLPSGAHGSGHGQESEHADGGSHEKSFHPNLHLVVVPDRLPACFDKVGGDGDTFTSVR